MNEQLQKFLKVHPQINVPSSVLVTSCKLLIIHQLTLLKKKKYLTKGNNLSITRLNIAYIELFQNDFGENTLEDV